jgi:hypothetical protein
VDEGGINAASDRLPDDRLPGVIAMVSRGGQ